jgi:Ni,Fe-hydrogenase III large subunit
MAALYIIIVILVGVIILLYYYSREKPRALIKEIERLRKSVVSGGLNFEQIEYRIASLREDISEKKKEIGGGTGTNEDMTGYLEELEGKLDRILEDFLTDKKTL